MRRAIVILLSALMLLVSFSSCSEDPRVAPTKVFIISVNGEKRTVTFNDNIRFVTIGIYETVQLDAVTNRVPDGATLEWFSIAPEVVSVDQNGLCTGLIVGQSSIIEVSINGGTRTATCLINVVADPDHIPDAEEGLSSIEIVSLVELMERDILFIENGVPTIKTSLYELSNIEFPVKCVLTDVDYPGATVEYQWSVDGVSYPDRTGETEIFNFTSYGVYTIVVQPVVHVPGVATPIPTRAGTVTVSVLPN